MLQNLHVKNLALIDEIEVDFTEGLNILSGETGAGKSIIIGSINLALGEKAPRELLRDDSDTALVELVFHVDRPETIEAIRQMDLAVEDGVVILSRKITSGRATAKINGEAVSASMLREVAALLIDIHGQHEHQSLLHKKTHLKILDAYAAERLGELPGRLLECHREYRRLREDLKRSDIDAASRERERSFLEYEVGEIEAAELKPGEDEALEQRFRRFANGKKLRDAVGAAQAAVALGAENASDMVGRALRALGAVSEFDETVAGMESQLAQIDDLLADVSHELSSYLSAEDFDEGEFYETEKRLDLINHLKDKYGGSIEGILEECRKKSSRIDELNNYEDYLNRLSTSLKNKEEELRKLCSEVSDIRRTAGVELAEAIRSALMDLNFLDVAFEIHFEKTEDYTPLGTDDVEFLISTNPGEDLKPLGKVASGGELSRIMLGVKTVMADVDDISTLIFDEIDSGISGRTAQMVSEKMNLLAKNHQIVCITHLPQIAAMADSHFLIEKSVENRSTCSRIHRLDEEESVRELARMLGGVEITDTVIQNAREMKTMAYMKK